MAPPPPPDPSGLAAHLRAQDLPDLGMRLWLAHSGSGLSRLGLTAPPYWAYVWAGGAALVQHLRQHPETLRGLRVLDYGAGSGVVGVAAAQAGAAKVWVWDSDRWAHAATRLNADLNGVTLHLVRTRPPRVDLVLAGDVFYAPATAAQSLIRLRHFQATGARVLIGDPDRADLPRDALTPLARYMVTDMGEATPRPATVYALRPA